MSGSARPVRKPAKNSFALTKRHERWSRVQARWKIADESAHRGMPETVESQIEHFLYSSLRWKFFNGDPGKSNENTGAVIAVAAMHKNLFLRVVAKNREKFRNLFVRGRSPSIHGNVHEANPQCFRAFFFPADFGLVFLAEIDNRGDAEFFQLEQTRISRLGATKQMIVDLAGIGNAGDAKFFSEDGMRCGWRGGWLLRLRAEVRGKKKRKKKSEK